VDKAFDTVWMDDLFYKLTLANIPSYIVHKISLYLREREFEAFFHTATSYRRGMRARDDSGCIDLPYPLQSYANDMHTPSHHIELALYADDTAIIATSRKPTLLVSYLES
jgi:hypothetical protein